MKYIPTFPYYAWDNKKLGEYITCRQKCALLLNGEIIDNSYLSLLDCEYVNLTEGWEGSRHFFGGEMTYDQWREHAENNIFKKPLRGLLQITSFNGDIVKQCCLV